MKKRNKLLAICFIILLIIGQVFNADLNRTAPILASTQDIDILAAFVLLRGHIVIGPETITEVNQNLLDKLLFHLNKIDYRLNTPNGRLLLPATEERDLGCDYLPNYVRPLCNVVETKCLSTQDMINLIPFQANTLHQAIARLCPLILFRQTKSICNFRPHHESSERKLKLVEPSIEKVWGFAILFVTLSIVVSMGGLIVLPFLKREFRKTILTLFEGLAAGGLAGSAILHLFPGAFGVADDKYKIYFGQTFLIFGGIYIFYIAERVLTILNSIKGRGKKKRSSSYREDDIPIQLLERGNNTPQFGTSKPHKVELFSSNSDSKSPKHQMDRCLASLRDEPLNSNEVCNSKNNLNIEVQQDKTFYVADMAGRRKDQWTSTQKIIDPVAWMIVLGDASLNFIDGLSIGAAFDRNILAGISISVAVMLEEVPHRLGTFAVLLRAGMEMKQSFLWIFISACSLYPGLLLGVFLGDAAEEASPYIFAMASGMFLYMALVDVMREMNRSMENATHKGIASSLQILALQNLGIIIAIIFLSFLAIYEKDLDFEAVEIKELTENALN